MSVESMDFTLENLERVNHIEWDKERELLSLRALGPEPLDAARIYWSSFGGRDNKRIATMDEALIAVEFLEAITGSKFTMRVEVGSVVWTIKDDEVAPVATNHPQVLRRGNVIFVGGVERGDEPHFTKVLEGSLTELLGKPSTEER